MALVIFYAMLIPVAVIFAAIMLRAGIVGGLASFGIVGEPGSVIVTSCQYAGRGGESCSGIFTPSGGAAVPIRVSVEGDHSSAQIHSDHILPVHVVDGDAWPEGMAVAGNWIIPLGLGCFFAVAFFVGAVGTVRHGLGRWASRSRTAG